MTDAEPSHAVAAAAGSVIGAVAGFAIAFGPALLFAYGSDAESEAAGLAFLVFAWALVLVPIFIAAGSMAGGGLALRFRAAASTLETLLARLVTMPVAAVMWFAGSWLLGRTAADGNLLLPAAGLLAVLLGADAYVSRRVIEARHQRDTTTLVTVAD